MKIFSPLRIGDDFRIRYNNELYELLNYMAELVRQLNVDALHNVHVVEKLI